MIQTNVAEGQKPARFNVTPVSVLLWLAIAGFFVVPAVARFAAEPREIRDPFFLTRAIGAAVGLLLLPMFVSWLAFHVARRSQRTATITFILVLVFATFAQLNAIGDRAKNRKINSQVSQIAQEMNTDLKRTLQSEPDKALDVADRHMGRLKNAAADLSGEQRQIAQAVVKIADRMTAAGKAHAAASQRVVDMNVLDLASLRTKQQIEDRRKVVQEFLACSKALGRTIDGTELALETDLRCRNVSPAGIKSSLSEWRSKAGPRLPLLRRMRESEAVWCDATLAALKTLDEQWGHWVVGADNGPRFDTATPIAGYNANLERIARAAEEQEKIQKQLVATLD